MDRPLPFPRYVWCEDCNTFEEHTASRAHDTALNGSCPKCGNRNLCSRPPASHEKALAKLLELEG